MVGLLTVGKNNGAAFGTTNAWAKLPLDTEVFNNLTGASSDLSNDTVTIPVGTHRLTVGALLWKGTNTGFRLTYQSGASWVQFGEIIGWANSNAADSYQASFPALIQRKITVTGGPITIRLEAYATATMNVGLGNVSGTAGADVWIMLEPATNAGVLELTGTNVGAGTTAGAWTKYPFDATGTNTLGATIDLAADTLQLASGTYSGLVQTAFYSTQTMQVKLRNTTDGADTFVGGAGHAWDFGVASASGGTHFMPVMFTLAATKTLQVQYWNHETGNLSNGAPSGTNGPDFILSLIKH